ncbi:hypothetical protein HFK89_05105 [Ralstonia pseudosolanacearum]|uniref:hypothetical protein n=1 Tax=Ralstonia pseudosolanacearum TaxID=1310165 RepID=UPI0008F80783|nr:hypothetical protein [Ralstonia pseudosolanacearum]MCK4161828.1 hypothetical protein [Ralstonia pseudosolanacearum]OIN76005.1 hypothetical protein BL248_09235 [Ralstonia solanacearum]
MPFNDKEPQGTAIVIPLKPRPPLFPLGRIVATRGVLTHLEREGIAADPYLNRHVRGDWGDVLAEDANANRYAVLVGARIMSSYRIVGERVWIITEADRSVTTLLFPSEY